MWSSQDIGVKVICYQSPSISPPLSESPDLKSKDRRAFEYFVSNTSSEMVGTWRAANWRSMILQCCASESVIQRIAIALGALHEHRVTGSADAQRQSLSHYAGAIRMVRDIILDGEQGANEMLLLACMLFCAFESMSGHVDSAIWHLNSGLSLMTQSATPSNTRSGLRSMLAPIFAQSDNDRMFIGDTSACSSYGLHEVFVEAPATFESIYEAQETLIQLVNAMLRGLKDPNVQNSPEDTHGTIQKSWQWIDAFDRWLPLQIKHASGEDLSSLLVLYMWRTTINAIIEADSEQGEMAWDKMYGDFEAIVDCGEQVVALCFNPVDTHAMARHHQCRSPAHILPHHSSSIVRELLVRLHDGTQVARSSSSSFKRANASIEILLRKARPCHEKQEQEQDQQAKGAGSAFRESRPLFALSHGIVYPLSTVAERSRQPKLRRRALAILETCNRQEGFWDSRTAAQLCKRLMRTEENLAAEEMTRPFRYEPSVEQAARFASPPTVKHASQIPNHCRVRVATR